MRLRRGFPLRMFSVQILSPSSFVLVPSWLARQLFLFQFFPVLQEELQQHRHHPPLSTASSPSPVGGPPASRLAAGSSVTEVPLTLKRRLYVLGLDGLYFSLL